MRKKKFLEAAIGALAIVIAIVIVTGIGISIIIDRGCKKKELPIVEVLDTFKIIGDLETGENLQIIKNGRRITVFNQWGFHTVKFFDDYESLKSVMVTWPPVKIIKHLRRQGRTFFGGREFSYWESVPTHEYPSFVFDPNYPDRKEWGGWVKRYEEVKTKALSE